MTFSFEQLCFGVSRSRSPRRERAIERGEKRPRSYSRSPEPSRGTPPPLKARKRSPTPEEEVEDVVSGERNSPSNGERLASESPRANSGSPERDSPAAAGGYQSPERESPADERYESPERNGSPAAAGRYHSPSEANGHDRSFSPRDDGSPVDGDEDDDDGNRRSPRGSESP